MYAMAAQGGPFAALAVTLLSVLIGAGIGWLLKRVVAPKRKAATPNDLGRTWAGWVIFFTSAQLAYFIGKLDALSFLSWLIGGGICIALAYIVGWAYGRFLRFRTSDIDLDTASDATYVHIDQELRTNNLDRATWTRAQGDADGNADWAKALYIKYRAERLLAASRHKSAHQSTLDAVNREKPAKKYKSWLIAATTGVLVCAAAAALLIGFLTEKPARSLLDFSNQGTLVPKTGGQSTGRFFNPADDLQTKPEGRHKLQPWEMDWSEDARKAREQGAARFGITVREYVQRDARSREICRDPARPSFVDLGECWKAVMAGRR